MIILCGNRKFNTAFASAFAKMTNAAGQKLTCGLSENDIFTLSSFKSNRLCVCQRVPIILCDGEIGQPREFVYRGCVGESLPILAAAAAAVYFKKLPE